MEKFLIGDPDAVAESMVAIYGECSGQIEKYTAIQERAKQVLADLALEMERSEFNTKAGKAKYTKSGEKVTFDTERLRAAVTMNPALRELVTPALKSTYDDSMLLRLGEASDAALEMLKPFAIVKPTGGSLRITPKR